MDKCFKIFACIPVTPLSGSLNFYVVQIRILLLVLDLIIL